VRGAAIRARLRFDPGYEPDFERGLVESRAPRVRLYGGTVRKFRFLSKNGECSTSSCSDRTMPGSTRRRH
jgi:hypothetical protein